MVKFASLSVDRKLLKFDERIRVSGEVFEVDESDRLSSHRANPQRPLLKKQILRQLSASVHHSLKSMVGKPSGKLFGLLTFTH